MAQQRHRYRIAAYRGNEPFAFVSYSHDDSEAVFVEMDALSAAGLRFKYDEGIHPGRAWDDEVADAIMKCAVFVFFATGRSVTSKNCRSEIALAVEYDRPVIAVHLEEVELPAGLKLSLGNRQAIVRARFDEVRYRERLIAAVREHVGGTVQTTETDPPTSARVSAQESSPRRPRRLWAGTAIALLLVAAGTAGVAAWRHVEASRVARAQLIAKIEQLVEQDQYGTAFTLAQPLVTSGSAPDDAVLSGLWRRIVLPATPLTSEAGATLSYKPYDGTDDGWIAAGKTPIEGSLDLPKGVVRIRLEKPGFQVADFVVANPGPSLRSPVDEFLKSAFELPDMPLPLAADGKVPEGMVLVPPTDEPMFLSGLRDETQGYDRRRVAEFAIDKFEVTNREYKEFVDASGYDNPTYWEGLHFQDEGRTLDWPDARARFVDRTGRPGPADWELSTYQKGQADLPVGGISWYEAVAYARFRHLSLPTIHHWVRAAFAPYEGLFETAPNIAAASRFLADGPVEARREIGLGPWGTVNTAGNAREWVWNFVGDQAVALGGAWSDYPEVYKTLVTARPMQRSPDLGLRLMNSLGPVADELLEPIPRETDDAYVKRAPMSDDAFAAMRFQFTVGTRKPSDVHVTQFAESDLWTAEEVLLTYAKDDVLSLYIVLPRVRHGPLQPILFGLPGGGAGGALPRPNREVLEQLRTPDVVVSGGRALVIPIWVNQYQRAEPAPTDLEVFTDRYRRRAMQYFQDGVRTIDYLATRDDMDAQRIGFMGVSNGSNCVAPPLLAFEGRIRTGVLLSAGVWVWPFPIKAPTMDIVSYAPRIRVPVLMVNGRYDSVLPYELSQKRLFDLLGTPAEDKRLVLFDVGHFTFPHSQLAKEVNDWLDRYLGPVK